MILNSNPNYNDANFNFSQDIVSNNRINFRPNPYMQNYLNYNPGNNSNNNNFIYQSGFFNNSVNQYMNPYNQQINAMSNFHNTQNIINPIYSNSNNQFGSKNHLNYKENIELDCICENQNYISKNELMQCILCNKYQHKECINKAKEIIPYICFNCQFMNNHFYLRHIKTILPAKEFIYKKKWEDDPLYLKEGTKTFEFPLDLHELYEKYDININNQNNSYYLAILCLTNNGKPFHLGFPDNINISINDKKFYNIDNKGFKRPLLLAIENNKYYIPKRRHLITSDKYEIPNAADFFSNINNNNHRITISFSNNLENYRGSEFEFVDVRHYLIYIGLFQEIKIPQMSLLRECKNLEDDFKIFQVFYEEKVKKIKWNKISNYVSLDNEQLNMSMISEISNQRIICPVRGLFCQHTDILDFGECCRYITGNNQFYKCFKCNKPMNIMYIDEMSEKIFNKYKNENFSQIYFSPKFKFIRGEKIEENNRKGKNFIKQIENEPSDESLSESFFNFHENELKIVEKNKYDETDNNQEYTNEIIEINSDTESMIIEPNNIPTSNLALEDKNMNKELEKRNEISNINNKNVYNINNNINNNSKIQDNIVVINNLDKSNDEIHPSENIENKENFNEEKKTEEEVITLMEEDEEEDKEDKGNSIYGNSNRIPNKSNEKDNLINNNTSSQQNQSSGSNNISDSSSIIRKNEESSFNVFQDIFNPQKSEQNLIKMNPSKENITNINEFEGIANEFLQKKRNKEVKKRNKKKLIEKERENDIHSPRKRIFRRIEDASSLKSNNKKSIKEREYILEKEKEKENNNKNNINKSNNINDIQNDFNAGENIINNQQTNYLSVSLYNNKINSNEKNSHNPNNKSIKNNKEIKNKRRNSDMTSSSNSFNAQSNNFIISEYDKKEINKNKRKKKKQSKLNKGKEKSHNKEKINNNNKLNSDTHNQISETSYNNISESNYSIQANENNEISDKNKIVENFEDDYETILIDRKDLIEIRPYKEHKDSNRTNWEEEDFINDFDIFENELLSNNQMEFLNYDYYHIQRKLREFCSQRYHDDEIFNGNNIFFNNFK